jgi:hypothetical protein
MKAVSAFALALALAVVFAADAVASDSTLFRAWRPHIHQIRRLNDEYFRAMRAVRRSDWGRRAIRRTIEVDRAMLRLSARISRGVRREHPSSTHGAKAKRCLLLQQSYWRRSNRFEIAALRAGLHRRWKRLDRLYERADRANRRQSRYYRCQRREFNALGMKQPRA